ncbi:MAG: DUF4340 domain-containing protein [Byssovorax sp.]
MSTQAKTSGSLLRGPLIHLAVAGASIALAAVLWSRGDEPEIAATSDVTVWAGHAGDVQHIEYVSKSRKVTLDAKKDEIGAYLIGVLDMEEMALPPAPSLPPAPPPAASGSAKAGAPAASGSAAAGAPASPSGSAKAGAPASSAVAVAPPSPSGSAKAGAPASSAVAGAPASPSGSAKAGAPAASGSAAAGAPPAPSASAVATPEPPRPGYNSPPGRIVLTFLSIKAGQKLVSELAPFKAMRALGKIPDADAAQFGLAQPEATVTVKVAGADKRLLLGLITPGGGDRYVKDAGTGEVFVVKGEPFRFLEAPESWLFERDLHDWKEPDVKSAKVIAGQQSRKLSHGGPSGKQFWADAKTPDVNDDGLNNWMSKLFQLRALEFSDNPPGKRELVLRVEFAGDGPLGFLELWRLPPAPDGTPEYVVKTERTRLFGRLSGNFTAQIEQDLELVLK